MQVYVNVFFSLMGTAAAGGDSAPVMHGSGDITNVPLGGANAARPINQSLSHVAQIGNNTGSLPSELFEARTFRIFLTKALKNKLV